MEYWRRKILLDRRVILTEEEETLVKEGPKSLSQAWRLSAIKYKYLTRGGTNTEE